jgi:hypothetical protein
MLAAASLMRAGSMCLTDFEILANCSRQTRATTTDLNIMMFKYTHLDR